MKKFTAKEFVLLFCMCIFPMIAMAQPTPPSGKKWVPVNQLTDNFNNFDSGKWQKGHPYWNGRSPSQFNNANISWANGNMRLKGSIKNPNRQGDYIWTACLTSKQKSFKKGMYAEARIKNADMAIVSSFWMQGNYSEIDVIENWGEVKNQQWSYLEYTMEMNTHYFINGWNNDRKTPKHYQNPGNAGNSAAFNVYGVWWKDSRTIIWYRNGVETARVNLPYDFNEDMYMFFDMEAFTWGPGVASNADLNNSNKNLAYYDYVKTYRLVNDSNGGGGGGSGGALIPNGNYYVKKASSNTYLKATAAGGNTTSVSNNGSSDTKWKFTHKGNNEYEITSVAYPNGRLEVPYGKTGRSVKIATTTWPGNANHIIWKAQKVGNNYLFKPKHDQSQALDLWQGNPTVHTWDVNTSNANQILALISTNRTARTVNDDIPEAYIKGEQRSLDPRTIIASADLHLYPNPTDGVFTIKNIDATNAEVQIIGTNGRTLLLQQLSPENGILSIDATKLQRGIYTVLITYKGGQQSLRFVKK